MVLYRKVVFGYLLILSLHSNGQDLEELNQQSLLNYGGSLTITNTLYHADGITNRRDPFFWRIGANFNIDLLGIIHAPFSLVFSQQNKRFAQPQPFNRFGISPTYKGLALHLGHRSMTFSDYTLGSNLFLGVGITYESEEYPFRISALYGRFAKPVKKYAKDGPAFLEPTLRRMGYGFKVGYAKNGQEIDLILFKALDDPSSVPEFDSVTVKAKENLILGFTTSNSISRNLIFESEYAFSLFSRDMKSGEVLLGEHTFVNNLGSLFTPRGSSIYTKAISANLIYNFRSIRINGKYRRVDPEYNSLGTTFLNDDLEDVSAGVNLPMLKSRLTMGINGGVQRNNLSNQLSTRLRRLIFSTNISWSASESLQLGASYSNFNSSTEYVQVQLNALEDSIEFSQISKTSSYYVSNRFGSKCSPYTVNWNVTIQDIEDVEDSESTFLSSNLSLQKTIMDWNLGFLVSYNKNETEQLTNVTIGPGTNVNRSFQKGKFRIGASANRIYIFTGDQPQTAVNNLRITTNLRPWKKHSLSLIAIYMARKSEQETTSPDIREFRASINYALRL